MRERIMALFSRLISRKGHVYRSCGELPLTLFIRCVEGDLWALKKPGPGLVTEGILENAWNSIFYEYIDLVRDPEHVAQLTLMREIALLEAEILLTEAVIEVLLRGYHDGLVEILKRRGFRVSLIPGETEHNLKELGKVLRQQKSKKLRLMQSRKQLEDLRKEAAKGGKREGADFEKVIAELSAFQGYRLDPKVVTVREYVAVSDRYKKHVEANKKNQKWKK